MPVPLQGVQRIPSLMPEPWQRGQRLVVDFVDSDIYPQSYALSHTGAVSFPGLPSIR